MSTANKSIAIALTRDGTQPLTRSAFVANPLDITLTFAETADGNTFTGADFVYLELHPDSLFNPARVPLAQSSYDDPQGTTLAATFSAAQLNQALLGNPSRDFGLVIYATYPNESAIQVFQNITLTLHAHPASLTAPSPPNAALALTKAQADLLYASLGSSAPTLTTARTIALTGDVTYTSPPFNGSANVTSAATLATVNSTPGSFGGTTAIPVITIDGKGRITAATTAAIASSGPTVQILGDSDATIAPGTTVARLVTAGGLTAARTYTLPSPAGYPTGSTLTFVDATGSLYSYPATLYAGSSNTINGGSSIILNTPYAAPVLITNGSNAWSLDIRGITRGGTGATDAAGARTNLGLGTADSLTVAGIVASGKIGIGTTAPLAKLDLAETWNAPAITVIGASGNGTTATITFATQTEVIPVGVIISVVGITPTGYNVTAVVTASTLNSVSYSNATTSAGSGGTVQRILTAVKANITDTASNAASDLMDLQVGGVNKFSIRKDGYITTSAGLTISGSIVQSSGNVIPSASLILDYFNQDVKLSRDAAGILAQRNGTIAQAFRVYNTLPSSGSTAGEWFEVDWQSTVSTVKIGSNRGVTGTRRAFNLCVDGNAYFGLSKDGASSGAWWCIANSGHLITNIHNAYDIGATGGVSCPRNIYVGTEIITPKITVNAGNLSSLGITFGTQSRLVSNGDGILLFGNSGITTFDRLQLGGTTSAFPAIKRNGFGIDIVLANDSGFAPIKGKITTDAAYNATVVADTGYIVIYDSTGTPYRVLCAPMGT